MANEAIRIFSYYVVNQTFLRESTMANTKQKIKIMMVEDHKLVRVGLKTLFEESSDIEVVAESESGKEAIEKARLYKPDVILMDIGLPDISGIESAKKILEENSEQKIVILTSHQDETEINECLVIGINAYALKDINTEHLIMIIKTVKDGAIWLDSRIVPKLRSRGGNLIPKKHISRSEFRAKHANLTEREYQVLKLLVNGGSNNDIANELCISEHTAKAHVCNIIQKLVVDDRTQAAVKAIREGLV